MMNSKIKRILLHFTGYFLGGLGLLPMMPAGATLSTGFHVPPFETSGIMMGLPFHFNLDQMLRNGPVVLYFSGAGSDLGCQDDAKILIDEAPKLRLYGAFLIALSVKDQAPVRSCRVRLPVAVATPSIAKLYAIPYPLSPTQNTTYVIAPDRRILLTYVSSDPASHMVKAMETIQKWQKAVRK